MRLPGSAMRCLDESGRSALPFAQDQAAGVQELETAVARHGKERLAQPEADFNGVG